MLMPVPRTRGVMFVFAAVVVFYLFLLSNNANYVAAQSHVGVESTLVDLGSLEKESENIASFRLVTTTPESFLVSLNKEPGTKDFFSRLGYRDKIMNYSEENIMDWVEVSEDSVELETISGDHGIIGAQKKVSFIVKIPEDAEPGYHIFRIKPIPILSGETIGQVGAKVVAVTSVNFLFNIEGEAIRDGIILDVLAGGKQGNRLLTNTYFQNTGTMTITARATQGIYRNGELIAESESAKELIAPGKMGALTVPFNVAGLSEGDYYVSTTVDFLTGSVSKNSTINIAEAILPPEVVEEGPKPPTWLIIILIVIVVIAVLIYKW